MGRPPPHVLIITFPAQGHINPSLQFAKRLIGMGVEVTFATTVFAQRCMLKSSSTATTTITAQNDFNLAVFSDGFDDGYGQEDNKDEKHKKQDYMYELQRSATNTLKQVIHTSASQGRPVSCLVYTLLLPWASEVARECHVQSALLWIQPAIVLDIYHYYFNGFEDEIKNHSKKPDWSIRFPSLPLLKASDLPSFMLPSCHDEHKYVLEAFKQQVGKLDEEEKPIVLVNTFDALEPESLKAIEKYNMVGIGPLIPSAFLDGKDPLDTSYCVDLFEKSKDYMCWLNSLPASSVVYVSFGSLLKQPKQQMEEIARGLLESGKSFLWVIREDNIKEEQLSCIQELEEKGMIVPWCSQLEVLTHPSLACFVCHCGWNSTLESLSCGVPLVAFPYWSDQGTNAKLIQDVWRTGVRVTPSAKEDGLVESDEIKRCIKLVMDDGEIGRELRQNAKKWKDLAKEAMIQGGTSSTNLTRFIDEVGQRL